VARRTFAFVRARRELAVVRIGRVAVGAFRKCNRLFKIAVGVTLNTIDLRVFPKQRKLCLRVIELLPRNDFLPASRGVAGFTRLREGSMMRIRVAVAAFCERDSGESRFAAGLRGRVAFFACDLRMQPGQREMRRVVIKFCSGFPIHVVVTLQTVLAKLAVMRILMARVAVLRQT